MDGKTIMVATLALLGVAACGATGPQPGASAADVDPLVAAMGGGDEFADELGAAPPAR